MADPDRPWEIDEPDLTADTVAPIDPAEPRYVFRCRYIINTIEPLELLRRRNGGAALLVRDLDGGPAVDIRAQGVFNHFEDAKASLVKWNTEKVALLEADLKRAVENLRVSQAYQMTMG